MSFSDKLYELRTSKGISQKDLADSLGVAQSSINYWEKGQRDPSLTVVKKIADFFGVSLDFLTGMNGEPTVSRDEFSNLVKKYQTLDADGRETVDFILNKEYKRCTTDFLIRAQNGAEYVLEKTQKMQSAGRLAAYHNAAHAIQNTAEEDQQHDQDMITDENF